MSVPDVAPAAPRILIVDDSRIVRATIGRHIKSRFSHSEAVDGEDGWAQLCADASIRAVISDLSMPKLDGFGLLQRIRAAADARIRSLPVIIISGDDEAAQTRRAARLGATEFITKGIGAVELVARLENLTALSEARLQLDSVRMAAAQNSATDILTELGTTALLIKQGASMFAYARRHRVPLSVVRVGIDDFAKLRARVGDSVADQILVAIARLLVSRLRKEDVVARTDAAEFAIAAPSASAAAAAKFARRLVEDIRGARITWQGKSVKLGAAVGIADSTLEPAESFADVFAAAGHRLERARMQSGDRVVAEDLVAKVVVPQVPSVEEALTLLATGRGAELQAFASELALRIYPLVKFCDDQFSVAERSRIEMAATQKLATLKPD